MSTSRTRVALLALHDYELTVVLDALNAYATAEEQDGDPRMAEVADLIASRARSLGHLACADTEQVVRHLGLGRYEHRPQG